MFSRLHFFTSDVEVDRKVKPCQQYRLPIGPVALAEVSLREAAEDAISEDTVARRELWNPETSVSPAPLLLGPQEYRSPTIWSADWRKGLPKGDPDRLAGPDDFVTWDDPSVVATLELMEDLDLPKPGQPSTH